MEIFDWLPSTALSASNLNEMQNIINNNITSEIDKMGTIIWSNNAPTSSFSSQTITLDDSLSNYNAYEILFRQNNTSTRIMSSGIIPIGYGTILSYNTSSNYYRPTATTVSGSTISFENAYQGSTIANSNVIPVYVIGHKTNLFS